MAEVKRKISLKVKWFIAICIMLLMVAMVFVFVQYAVDESEQGTKSITKWGVTLNEVPSTEKFRFSSDSLEEDKHWMCASVSGLLSPPLAGQTERVHYSDVSGVAEKDLYLTFDLDIEFPNDAFTKDGVFDCPVQFDCENKYTNEKMHINCRDYTSKTKLREDLLSLCDSLTDVKVSAGTDMEKCKKELEEKLIISSTSDEGFDTKGYQNTKMFFEFKSIIADEPDAISKS